MCSCVDTPYQVVSMVLAAVMEQLCCLQALGVADKKSTKAIKLSTAKQRKHQAKGLWSKAE